MLPDKYLFQTITTPSTFDGNVERIQTLKT